MEVSTLSIRSAARARSSWHLNLSSEQPTSDIRVEKVGWTPRAILLQARISGRCSSFRFSQQSGRLHAPDPFSDVPLVGAPPSNDHLKRATTGGRSVHITTRILPIRSTSRN